MRALVKKVLDQELSRREFGAAMLALVFKRIRFLQLPEGTQRATAIVVWAIHVAMFAFLISKIFELW